MTEPEVSSASEVESIPALLEGELKGLRTGRGLRLPSNLRKATTWLRGFRATADDALALTQAENGQAERFLDWLVDVVAEQSRLDGLERTPLAIALNHPGLNEDRLKQLLEDGLASSRERSRETKERLRAVRLERSTTTERREIGQIILDFGPSKFTDREDEQILLIAEEAVEAFGIDAFTASSQPPVAEVVQGADSGLRGAELAIGNNAIGERSESNAPSAEANPVLASTRNPRHQLRLKHIVLGAPYAALLIALVVTGAYLSLPARAHPDNSREAMREASDDLTGQALGLGSRDLAEPEILYIGSGQGGVVQLDGSIAMYDDRDLYQLPSGFTRSEARALPGLGILASTGDTIVLVDSILVQQLDTETLQESWRGHFRAQVSGGEVRPGIPIGELATSPDLLAVSKSRAAIVEEHISGSRVQLIELGTGATSTVPIPRRARFDRIFFSGEVLTGVDELSGLVWSLEQRLDGEQYSWHVKPLPSSHVAGFRTADSYVFASFASGLSSIQLWGWRDGARDPDYWGAYSVPDRIVESGQPRLFDFTLQDLYVGTDEVNVLLGTDLPDRRQFIAKIPKEPKVNPDIRGAHNLPVPTHPASSPYSGNVYYHFGSASHLAVVEGSIVRLLFADFEASEQLFAVVHTSQPTETGWGEPVETRALMVTDVVDLPEIDSPN